MSNTKTQAKRREAIREAYTKCVLAGLDYEHTMSVIQKRFNTTKGLNPTVLQDHKLRSEYKPTFRDVAQFAPKKRLAHGLQRAGYRLPKNVTIDVLGNIDALIPVSQIQNDTRYRNTLQSRADVAYTKKLKRAEHAAKVDTIQHGKENLALMSMAQLLEIERSRTALKEW